MDDFRIKLGAQVNRFVEQAHEVDQLDRELVVQRDRALKLQLAGSRLQKGTDAISKELELILHHQDEMHSALSALERRVEDEGRSFPDRPGERQQAYALVEELDKQIGDTRALLTDSIATFNHRHAGADDSTRMTKVVSVLDVHLNAFQYLETNATKLDAALAHADRLLVTRGAAANRMYD